MSSKRCALVLLTQREYAATAPRTNAKRNIAHALKTELDVKNNATVKIARTNTIRKMYKKINQMMKNEIVLWKD